MGTGMPLPVWVRVSSSNVSSSVPKPPGRQMNARLSFTSISLRVKKYFMLTYFSSPAMIGLAPCSNGSRIDTPMLFSRPAPSMPACMIPGPAPVMTIHPFSARLAATLRVCSQSGSWFLTRADPKIVTFGASRYGSNIENASRISVMAAAAILRSRWSGRSRINPSVSARNSSATRASAGTPNSSSRARARARTSWGRLGVVADSRDCCRFGTGRRDRCRRRPRWCRSRWRPWRSPSHRASTLRPTLARGGPRSVVVGGRPRRGRARRRARSRQRVTSGARRSRSHRSCVAIGQGLGDRDVRDGRQGRARLRLADRAGRDRVARRDPDRARPPQPGLHRRSVHRPDRRARGVAATGAIDRQDGPGGDRHRRVHRRAVVVERTVRHRAGTDPDAAPRRVHGAQQTWLPVRIGRGGFGVGDHGWARAGAAAAVRDRRRAVRDLASRAVVVGRDSPASSTSGSTGSARSSRPSTSSTGSIRRSSCPRSRRTRGVSRSAGWSIVRSS